MLEPYNNVIHSKTKDINYKNLKIQPYIKHIKISTEEKQFMFKLRTSMTDVKTNFLSMNQNNVIYDLCDNNLQQTVQHLLCCPEIIKRCKELQDNLNVQFVDIFSKLDSQIKALHIIKAVFETKVKIESENENNAN